MKPKAPPHSLEAEQLVIGGLLIDPEAWERIGELLVEGDFYQPALGQTFAAIRGLTAAAQPVDVVTVSEKLSELGQLEQVGGVPFLADIAANTATAINIGAHAQIVRARALQRALIRAGTQIAENGFESDGQGIETLLTAAELAVFDIAERGSGAQQKYRAVGEVLDAVFARIQEVSEKGLALTGASCGYVDLDQMTSGMEDGQLIIVAARPGMGKTAFAMNIVEHVALSEKLPVAVFNLEMPAEQLTQRMLSSLGRVDQHKVRTGRLESQDWSKLTSALQLLSDAPIYIDDSASLSPTEMRARCRRIKREHGLGLVVVDYLQLMQVPGIGANNRVNEISEISRSLKVMAKEMSVPVIALSQLNRQLENRPDKRPMMSDLRESGAIEQDADVILFIYRDEYYNPQSEKQGIAEVIIGKQRNGPLGKVELAFLGPLTRFENLARDPGPSHFGTFQ